MKLLLNTSTYNGSPFLFDEGWTGAENFLNELGFHGYELYPVGENSANDIPNHIIHGMHLRFFVIISPIWRNNEKRLIEIFGDWDSVDEYYGGRNAQWISDFYRDQLDLAESLGCPYVVFHPVNCELEYVYSWNFPWTVKDTLDVSAEIINAAMAESNFTGKILFENLWWPGSFTLGSPWEYDYLLSKVNYSNCGITLDTGHLLSTNSDLRTERDAADYINKCIDSLGEISKSIKNVHLNKSLTGEYIFKTKNEGKILNPDLTLKDKLKEAYMHVSRIDCHEAFEESVISSIYDKIDPDTTVFEFTYGSMEQWLEKITLQKNALYERFWKMNK